MTDEKQILEGKDIRAMNEEPRKMRPKKSFETGEDKLVITAIVLIVCISLVVGLLFVIGISGGRKKDKGIVAQTTATSATTTSTTPPATTATVKVEEVLVPPLSIYRRRNPFQPLIDMEASAATSSLPVTQATTGAGIITVPPQLEPGAASPNTVLSRAVTLEGITEQNTKMFARIWVADRLFDKVAVGDTFAESYKLLAISKDLSATVLYGDERFTIFVGQSIYW